MKRHTMHLLGLFVTGALAALPLAATIGVFWWAASLLIHYLGPESPVGRVMVAIGLGITGSEVVGYLFGIGLVVVMLLLLGALVETGVQRGVATIFQAVLQRIPIVRTVYDLLKRLVGLLAQREAEGAKSMSAVWCHFGGVGGAAVLALLSTPQPVLVGGQRYVGVLVPTAPVPVGGGLLFVPLDWVTPADVGAEALTSIYVSMGVTAGQYLGTEGPPVPSGRAVATADLQAQPAPPAPPAAVPPSNAA